MLQSTRFLWLLIALLLGLNLVTLGSIWLAPALEKESKTFRPPHILMERLEWSEEQTQAFEAARARHWEGLSIYRQQEIALRKELFSNLKSQDTLKVAQITRELGQLRGIHEQQLFAHFQELRTICKGDQVKEFDSLMEEMASIIGMPPPHHRGPGPKGPPHHRPGDGPPR
ncbi:MAG: hypothetical protein ACFB10_21450 [Salibacteraceae bacterium]